MQIVGGIRTHFPTFLTVSGMKGKRNADLGNEEKRNGFYKLHYNRTETTITKTL